MMSIAYDGRTYLFLSPSTTVSRVAFVSHSGISSFSCFSRKHSFRPRCCSQTLPGSTIQRIADKLRSLGVADETVTTNADLQNGEAGEIFIPLPRQLRKYRVGHTLDPSWSTPEIPEQKQRVGKLISGFDNYEESSRRRTSKEAGKLPTLAELRLSDYELRRLRKLGIGERRVLKIGKAGITEGVVNGIHERWRRFEVVKIECEDLCKMNMKRTHDLLEKKTGGLVVWRSGSRIVLYRGPTYKYPYFIPNNTEASGSSAPCSTIVDHAVLEKREHSDASLDPNLSSTAHSRQSTLVYGVGSPNRVRFQLPGEAEVVEKADNLLANLGPRFTKWWGYEPLPVDGDLLPAVVPGYRRPFRVLPYGIDHMLRNDEITALRRLGGHLPFHFALGRNRKLQGLATSILKLWDKCEVVKIAVKRGIQSADSKIMAEELKSLTGGTLLARNEEVIVLYRGKDFLPLAVSAAINERKNSGMVITNSTDHARLSDSASKVDTCFGIPSSVENLETEYQGCESFEKDLKRSAMETAANIDSQISMAIEGEGRNKKLSADLEKSKMPNETEVKEEITEAEKIMLKKIGLKMKPFLLLGRRGVFAGTVENIHLHWKYRELVKIICKERSLEAVHKNAYTLEAESGGVLVGIESVSKGYAIILYRGKDYKRPSSLRPPTLLSRKESLKLFVEEQRRKSLKLHALNYGVRDSKNVESDDDKISTSELAVGVTSEMERSSTGQAYMSIPSSEQNHRASNDDQNQLDEAQNDQTVQIMNSNAHELHSLFSKARDYVSDEKTGITSENEDDLVNPIYKAEKTSRVTSLSNRERLLLRKQALNMKHRPVLAVGKRNVVAGVANAIKSHFEKHPLAIVNVKGRAHGTDMKDLIYKLEQETGGIFVSQEPNKVILYRGWGASSEQGSMTSKMDSNVTNQQFTRQSISHNLIEAIRFECGLQTNL